MIIVDQVRSHDSDDSGDDTVPPGITGLEWCHIVSTVSLLELETFLTDNVLTVLCSPTNIRTPLLGSLITYAGLSQDQRDAAIVAGASPQRQQFVVTNAFDSPGPGSTYEP